MFLNIAQKRRSIRKYQNRKIEAQKIELLVEAALRSPSSRGINPWEFIIVEDESILFDLSRAKVRGAEFLKAAPLAVVVCADTGKSDVWVEDASIASTYLLLCAQSLDLGACWIQIRNREATDGTESAAYVSAVLGIPEGIAVESIIAMGYPDEEKPPHSRQELRYDRVFWGAYGLPFAGIEK